MEYSVSSSQLETLIAEDDGVMYLDVDGTFYVLNSCLKERGNLDPSSRFTHGKENFWSWRTISSIKLAQEHLSDV